MAVTNRHNLYAVGVGTGLLSGIGQQSVLPEVVIASSMADGRVYAEHQAVVSVNPGGSFTTEAIAKALDLIALAGVDISSLTGGIKLYAQKHAQGGGRASGTAHRLFTVNAGICAPTTLQCEARGNASIGYGLFPIYNGTNAPVVESDGVALPALDADDERFTLGPVTIESVTITQVQSIALEFGISVERLADASEIHDTFASIVEIKPMLRIRTNDLLNIAAAKVPINGLAATHANSTLYLRKRAAGGTFVADGTAEHISMTVSGLAAAETIMDAGGSGVAGAEIRVELNYDATNDPIVIDTTAAIV